jgi:hypothetical protein
MNKVCIIPPRLFINRELWEPISLRHRAWESFRLILVSESKSNIATRGFRLHVHHFVHSSLSVPNQCHLKLLHRVCEFHLSDVKLISHSSAKMWRRAYLLLVLVRLYFALSPSYLHPDENFQGPEVIAGKEIPFVVVYELCEAPECPIAASAQCWATLLIALHRRAQLISWSLLDC